MTGVPAEWSAGIYTENWTERTYERLEESAAASLAAGRSAIIDGTFLNTERRHSPAEIGAAGGAPVILVETICDGRVVADRLAKHALSGDSRSDAKLATQRLQ